MNRRAFLAASAAVSASAACSVSANTQEDPPNTGKMKLRYAPGLGSFKAHAGKDPIDNIKFMADQGITAIFDNWLVRRSPAEQEAIAKELQKHDMMLGPFILVANQQTKAFTLNDKDAMDAAIKDIKIGIETAKRTGGKWGLIVPGGYDKKLHIEYQTANVIDNLRRCAEILEPAGLVGVLEPLNIYVNHPDVFLQRMPQSYMICRAVNSPCMKIVNDLYHQQITEGNLIHNIDMSWNEIGAFHLGDTPGRREPGTGEINYKNIFKHIHDRGFKGVLCMEHGVSKGGIEGEKALLAAYRQCDDF
ncbi:MAG: TIM barrel protein [Phycisphaerae bacterium]|nr:TIM barrel protein [Phycisphaerae bacterium]